METMVDGLLAVNQTLRTESELKQKLSSALNAFNSRAYVWLEGETESTDYNEFSFDLHFERLDHEDVQKLISIIGELPDFD